MLLNGSSKKFKGMLSRLLGPKFNLQYFWRKKKIDINCPPEPEHFHCIQKENGSWDKIQNCFLSNTEAKRLVSLRLCLWKLFCALVLLGGRHWTYKKLTLQWVKGTRFVPVLLLEWRRSQRPCEVQRSFVFSRAAALFSSWELLFPSSYSLYHVHHFSELCSSALTYQPVQDIEPEFLIDKSQMNICYLRMGGGDQDHYLQIKGTVKCCRASLMAIQVRSPTSFARGWKEWTRLK